MATGVVRDSDETFEFLCSVCKGKNRNTEADTFCTGCHDYYCSTCIQAHNDIPVLKSHEILDKTSFPQRSSVQFPAVPTERCKQHGHQPLVMYCENDNVVGCSTCMSVKHR
jgi:hypothetical protein